MDREGGDLNGNLCRPSTWAWYHSTNPLAQPLSHLRCVAQALQVLVDSHGAGGAFEALQPHVCTGIEETASVLCGTVLPRLAQHRKQVSRWPIHVVASLLQLSGQVVAAFRQVAGGGGGSITATPASLAVHVVHAGAWHAFDWLESWHRRGDTSEDVVAATAAVSDIVAASGVCT